MDDPRFEIREDIFGNLCVTVNSLDYILTKIISDDNCSIEPDIRKYCDLILKKRRYQLNDDVGKYCYQKNRAIDILCQCILEGTGQ